jgi:DNA-binding NarL/FixJ family response regulator
VVVARVRIQFAVAARRLGCRTVTASFDPLSSPPDITRVVIADDHPLVRGALCAAVASALPGAEIREAFDLPSLGASLTADHTVDLVLLDLAMPGVSGFSGLLYLRCRYPEVPVIVVSATEDRAVMRRCIEVGAAGFIPKTTAIDKMREAICRVLAGDIWTPPDLDLGQTADPAVADTMRRLASLTPQQLRVMMMLTQGRLNKQIAFEIKVSEATVKAHVSAILQKFGVDSRTQAVIAVSKIEQGGFSREAPTP